MNDPHSPDFGAGSGIAYGAAGASAPHDSAALHVAGEALYTDDLPEPSGLLHVAVGVSPIPHGRLRGLDLDAVQATPGVVAVITAADIPGVNDVGPIQHDDPIFAHDVVLFAGQPVFAVAATDVNTARRAARLARFDLEPLPAILTIDDAMSAQSYVLPPVHVSRGDAGAALARAPHRLRGKVRAGGQDHFYLEGQIALAIPREHGGIHIHASTQHPGEVQHMVAHALGIRAHDVVVECRRMGGGFGGKETQMSLYACVAAIIARRTGRAAKLRLDRDDDMRSTGKRHAFSYAYDVGFDDDGRILGLDLTLASRCGFSADLSGPVNDRAVFHVDNVYWLPDVALHSYRCRTNTVSDTAFRGFGGPQGMFPIEHVIDEIALSLGRDPLDVRIANLYGTTTRNVTPYGMTVEDNIAPEIIDRLAASARYRERRAQIAQWNRGSPVIKRGIALTAVKFGISFTATHYNQAGALLHLYNDGTLLLNHGGTEMGQGLFTKVAQVVAQELGVPLCDGTRVGVRYQQGAQRVADGGFLRQRLERHGGAQCGSYTARTAGSLRRRPVRLRSAKCRIRRGQRDGGREEPALRRARAHGVHGARAIVGDRLLRDAADPLRPQDAVGAAVLLFRLRRRRVRGGHRYPDRRAPAAGGRYPARRGKLAQPGTRPGTDRGRVHAGMGLARDGGALVERTG